jgi:hypothetical protein
VCSVSKARISPLSLTISSFQAYTSCTVLLQSAVQKQLHGFSPADWQEELEKAQICLSVLEWCGRRDSVAQKFHEKLSGMLKSMETLDLIKSKTNFSMYQDAISTQGMSEVPGSSSQSPYLFIIPNPDTARSMKTEEHTELSIELLNMLCRPYGAPENRAITLKSIEVHFREDPMRYEQPQLFERLEWNFESKLPFTWNLDKIAPPSVIEPLPSPGTLLWQNISGTPVVGGTASVSISDTGTSGTQTRLLASVRRSSLRSERDVMNVENLLIED